MHVLGRVHGLGLLERFVDFLFHSRDAPVAASPTASTPAAWALLTAHFKCAMRGRRITHLDLDARQHQRAECR